MNKVRDYIYKDISSVSESSSLRRVINTMRLHRMSILPVVNQLCEYQGCISEQGILHAAIPAYMKTMKDTSFMAQLDQISIRIKGMLDKNVKEFINRDYPYVSPDDTMSYAADLLYRHNGRILPVVENKKLIGLITRIEILSVSLNK